MITNVLKVFFFLSNKCVKVNVVESSMNLPLNFVSSYLLTCLWTLLCGSVSSLNIPLHSPLLIYLLVFGFFCVVLLHCCYFSLCSKSLLCSCSSVS